MDAVDWDDSDGEERVALHEAIREGIEDAKAGRTIDAKQWAADLHSPVKIRLSGRAGRDYGTLGRPSGQPSL